MTFATAGVRAAVVRTAVVRTAVGLAGLAAAACASVPAAGEPELPAQLARRLTPQFRHDHVAPSRSTLTEIGTDVLSFDPNRSVYDVVQRQWPAMFRPTPRTLIGSQDPRGDLVGVYAKAGWMGGQETLRTVRAHHVLALYRLSPAQEFAHFGRRHDGGAVEIVWR